MIRKNIWLLLAALVFSLPAFSQNTETIFNRAGLSPTDVWYGMNYMYSSHNDDWVYNRGGQISLEFGQILEIGWGWERYKEDATIEGVSTPFSLRHNGIFLGLTPASHKVIHPRISLLAGGGRLKLKEDNDDVTDRVFVFHPQAGIEINVFKWARLGVEGGYRFVGGTDINVLEPADVSAPTLNIHLRFGFTSNDDGDFDFNWD